MKQQLIDTYLDYINNYLSIPVMAEHYELTYEDMKAILRIGRSYFENKYKGLY